MLEENRRVLAARGPAVAARIAAARVPSTYELTRAPDGAPLLSVAGIPLHHTVDPVGDGIRWARAAVTRLSSLHATRAVVIGLGLGYHLEALAERFNGTIVVVEPDLAICQIAFAERDLSQLLSRVVFVDRETVTENAEGAKTLILSYAPVLLIPGGVYRRAAEQWQASAARTGMRLKILVVSPLYGGSFPIAGFASRALSQLGHQTQLLDLSSFHDGLRGVERFGARARRRAELESRFCDVLAAGVAATVEATEPDVVLVLAQAPLNVPALQAIGAQGAIRVLWFVEDFRRFRYWRDLAAHYDYVFTIQEDGCLESIATVTAAKVAYLPCGFDPDVHRPLTLGPTESAVYGSDLSFVGAGYRNRRLGLRCFLDTDFRIWGSDWAGADELERVVQRGGARIDTEETVRIFNATRVNLNLHSSTYHDGVDPRGDFVNPRTFELAGAGAFQVVDARTLLPPLFAVGRELAVGATVAEMRELAGYYLAHPGERTAMAERARARALNEHTYRHRMETMLGTVLGREQDRLLTRSRTPTVGDVAQCAAGKLAGFLARLEPTTPLTLEAMVASVAHRTGPLDEAEAIMLFLQQFDELYLQEHRA